jgi:hypothetical protein
MNSKSLLPLLAGFAIGLFGAPATLHAQRFAGYSAGDDVSSSLGEFRLVVDASLVDIMDAGLAGSVFNTTETWPGSGILIYDGGVFTSPVLYDAATTIGRSAPMPGTAPQDTLGALAGQAPGRTYVSDSQLTVRPLWLPDATGGVFEVHTYMKSLNLSDSVTTHLGISVKAGMDAPTRPVSAGEVQAYSTNADWPARSFFNVYVQVAIPTAGALPAVQLVNVAPLLVLQPSVYYFPPRAFYIHGNTNAVPVYFNTDVTITTTNGSVTLPRGTLLGQLTLAGHGMSYSEFDIPSFETEMETEITTSTMPQATNPFPHVTIQDYAPNYYAVPVPVLTQVRWTNGAFSFTVNNVTATRTCYVQACTNLSQAVWRTIRTNVPVTNSFLFTDPAAATNPPSFYRVLAVP